MNNIIKLPIRVNAKSVKEAIRNTKDKTYFLETERPHAQCPSHLVTPSLEFACGHVTLVEEVDGQFIATVNPMGSYLDTVDNSTIEIVPLTIHHGDAIPDIAYYTLRLK